jgi:hypothetical protein
MLFGKIFNEITLEEALYILNMDNYKKELNNFQKDFMNLNDEDLKIKGIFERFNEIIKDKEFESIRNMAITTRKNYNSLKDIKIEIPTRTNCVLGSYRGITDDNINAVNYFFKNYHKIK